MDYFTKLPNEILIEIFECCRLLPLTLVCQKFAEVIGNSPALMKKVILVISEKISVPNLLNAERKYIAVYFKFNYKIKTDCLKLFHKFNGIKSLEFTRCIIQADLFLKILEVLPDLESLSIYSTFLSNKSDLEQFEPPQMMRLNRLSLRNSEETFLEYLYNSSLKSLYIGFSSRYSTKTIENFLQTQSKVKVIEYLSVPSFDDSLMKVILQDMKNLEKLHLACDKIDMNLVGNLNLTNYSVKSLNLYGNFPNACDINIILNFFKNLLNLEIEMNNMLEPANILQMPSSLQSLSIAHCSGDYFNAISIRNLKKLQLTDANFTAEEWSRFASRNPAIEFIAIKDESTSNEIFTGICLNFPFLNRFEISYDPERLTPDIQDFISSENFPQNIKTLKLTQRNNNS